MWYEKTYFHGLAGKNVIYNGAEYTLLEDPYCEIRVPRAPLEPRAQAETHDGRLVEIYWYLFDAQEKISEENINGILEIEEDEDDD